MGRGEGGGEGSNKINATLGTPTNGMNKQHCVYFSHARAGLGNPSSLIHT